MLDSRANNGSCERTVKFGAEEELLELLRERGGEIEEDSTTGDAISRIPVHCRV